MRRPSRGFHVHLLIDSLGHGGAETLLSHFAQGALAAGIDVSVAYLHPRTESVESLQRLGIEPTYVPVRSLLHPRDRRAVRDHLQAVAPDLLHTHLGTSDVLGSKAARSLRIPSVSTLHVMDWEGIGRGLGREQVKLRFLARTRRRCAARVIAVSEAARRSYVEHGLDSPAHVVTAHNGVLDETRPGGGARIRDELGIGRDELVVGMVGVLRGGKGHDVAINAVAALRVRFTAIRLLVVGEGTERARLEALAREREAPVAFCGFRDDVQQVLDAVDVVAHPSSIDALPTALIEAMAAGVPVVATDVGGIPELVGDGQTGLLIPSPSSADVPASAGDLASALATVLDDPELRRRLGQAGRQRFEAAFTAERWIERLVPIYEEALSGATRT